MQSKIVAVSQELLALKLQKAKYSRNIKLSETTEQQIKETVSNSKSTTPGPIIWKGVGKIFLTTAVDEQVSQLKNEREPYKEQISALEKKQADLETTYKNLINGFTTTSAKP